MIFKKKFLLTPFISFVGGFFYLRHTEKIKKEKKILYWLEIMKKQWFVYEHGYSKECYRSIYLNTKIINSK